MFQLPVFLLSCLSLYKVIEGRFEKFYLRGINFKYMVDSHMSWIFSDNLECAFAWNVISFKWSHDPCPHANIGLVVASYLGRNMRSSPGTKYAQLLALYHQTCNDVPWGAWGKGSLKVPDLGHMMGTVKCHQTWVLQWAISFAMSACVGHIAHTSLFSSILWINW